MPTPTPSPTQKLDAIAIATGQSLVKSALKVDGFAEILDRQKLWTELRSIYKTHLRLFQDFTVLTITASADGQLLGWTLDKRKATSGVTPRPDPAVESAARRLPQLNKFDLAGIKHLPLDDTHAVAVATFRRTAANESFDVSVNETSGEIIGLQPTPVAPAAVTLSEKQSTTMESLAFTWLEKELTAKASSSIAKKTHTLFHLAPLTTTQDAGRITRAFRVYRFFSLADVSIDERTMDIVGWHVESLKAHAPTRSITPAAAITAARPELKASAGVADPRVTFDVQSNDQTATVHWAHVENKINIEGDHTTVILNATTGKPYSVWRKWRKVPAELFKPPRITQEQALPIADAAITHNPDDPPGKPLGASIIQVSPTPNEPSDVRDFHVWRVGYVENRGISFREVAVDSQTGDVVRVTGW